LSYWEERREREYQEKLKEEAEKKAREQT